MFFNISTVKLSITQIYNIIMKRQQTVYFRF